jgi:hypothetical protein
MILNVGLRTLVDRLEQKAIVSSQPRLNDLSGISQAVQKIPRLDLGQNWGIYGPTEGGTFAVRKVLGGPAEQSIDLMKPSGERVGRWPFDWSSDVLGVASGAVVTLPSRIARMYPPPGRFILYPPYEPLKIQGELHLYREQERGTFAVQTGKKTYRFKRTLERGTAVSLIEDPPTIAVFDPVNRASRDIWVRDLESGRSHTVRLDVGPALGTQFPEILLRSKDQIIYLSETMPDKVSAEVPLLRERDKVGEEVYRLRYLMAASLNSGRARCLAKVETVGYDSRGGNARIPLNFPGPDLVLMDGTLLVRANTALFLLKLV